MPADQWRPRIQFTFWQNRSTTKKGLFIIINDEKGYPSENSN